MSKPGRPPIRPPLPPAPSRDERDDFWDNDAPVSGGGLNEVERAISILDGRHPDHARLQRETLEASRKKRAALEVENTKERRRAVRRAAIAVVTVAVLGSAGWLAYATYKQRAKLEGMLDKPAAPFISMGFAAYPPPRYGPQDRVEASIDTPSCVIAVGASAFGDAVIDVQRDGEKSQGKGSIGWCSCGPEHVKVQVTSGTEGQRSVRLLHMDAHAFGGTYVFSFANARPSTLLEGPCAEEHLDGWLTEKHYPVAAMPPEWLAATPIRKKLRDAGFRPLAIAGAALPFVVAEPAPQSCVLALPSDPDDILSLRIDGGTRVLSKVKGPLAWCDAHASAATVWREGKGEIAVISVPARRIGGVLGLREVALRAGLGKLAVWLKSEDLGWDAAEAARASGISEPVVVDYLAAKHDAVRDARVVSVSATEGAVVAPDTGSDLVFASCSPPLDAKTRALQMFCVQASPQRWRDTGTKGSAGGAESALPFWMSNLAKAHDPDAVRTEAELFAFARRVATEGFGPTVLEAVIERPAGAEVLGRAGEDAIIAVGIEAQPPFVFTYSDGPTWTLGGEPRVIALEAGKHVVLTPTPTPSAPKEARRTIVFRRATTATSP
ncbi:MAG: hypothetical protein ABIP39_02235 [Polyangiaceae bacterium]